MKCSDCVNYKTKNCYVNRSGADWDNAEDLDCFSPKRRKPAAVQSKDRRETYEYKKTRAGARERIGEEQAQGIKKFSKTNIAIICMVLAIIAIVIAVIIGTC